MTLVELLKQFLGCRNADFWYFRNHSGDRFDTYCTERGISATQFFENAIRYALGEPLTIPSDALGISEDKTDVEPESIAPDDIQGLEDVVREIVRDELSRRNESKNSFRPEAAKNTSG
jgi:hypothetical protein